MPGLRSLRNRLAVIFALIILGAIGTIYLSVTPRLEAALTSQRLDQVGRRERRLTPPGAPVPAAEGAAAAQGTNKTTKDRAATATSAASPSAQTPSCS